MYFTMWFHAIFTTNRIQQLVFVMDMQCVYCDVWINFLHITSLDEMQEESRIHNKLLYWIKCATKTTCFGPLLWSPIEEGRNMSSLLCMRLSSYISSTLVIYTQRGWTIWKFLHIVHCKRFRLQILRRCLLFGHVSTAYATPRHAYSVFTKCVYSNVDVPVNLLCWWRTNSTILRGSWDSVTSVSRSGIWQLRSPQWAKPSLSSTNMT